MRESSIYVGKGHDSTGYPVHVFAEISIEHQDGPHTTTRHEQIDGMDRISICWTTIDGNRRIRSSDTLDSIADRWWMSTGQISPEDRVVTSYALNATDAEELNSIWERWHLSDMQAGCAHMPTWEGIVGIVDDEPTELVPMRYGRPDYPGWALAHVVCPETGYKWGSSWLTEQPPADVLDTVRRIMGRGKLVTV